MISSFGLSNPAADADNSATGTECVTDYVIVRPSNTFRFFYLNIEVFRFLMDKLQPLPPLPLQLLALIAFVADN